MTADGPTPIKFSQLDLESRLEDMLVKDPSLAGVDAMIVGRQVATLYGGFIDVLAVDAEGRVHVLELKRDRTPREVVAQVLDYGSWVQDLTLDQVADLYLEHNEGSFADAFAERFGSPVPDAFNTDQQLTIVASALDAASDRIIHYLADRFDVPINAVFFRYFVDGGSEYLTRTWLISPAEAEKKPGKKVQAWNGRDFYVVLGRVEAHNRWPLCSKYGFVSAGGGPFYSKPLNNLGPGHRVFAYVGGAGYVGVGEVTGTVVPLTDVQPSNLGGERLADQPDFPDWLVPYLSPDDPNLREFAVPVEWKIVRPTEAAFWEKGLFASQVPVCKLRDRRTLEAVSRAFGLEDDAM